MEQVYLGLVVLNIVSGLVLAREGLKWKLPVWDGVFAAFENRLSKGILGAATFFTGFLGLLFVLPGDQLFIGDLLPSLSAMLCGTILAVDFYQKPADEEQAPAAPLGDLLGKNKILFGLLGLTLGLIHFLIPRVIFL